MNTISTKGFTIFTSKVTINFYAFRDNVVVFFRTLFFYLFQILIQCYHVIRSCPKVGTKTNYRAPTSDQSANAGVRCRKVCRYSGSDFWTGWEQRLFLVKKVVRVELVY